MLLSSRTSPRLSLRKSGGYDPNDRGPSSSTSSRFSFNHLIKSPPPSPSLPALVPRHGKPAPSRTPRKWFRGFLWVSGILGLLYFGFTSTWLERPMTAVGWATDSGNQYEMVGESELPDFPTPVIVTDKRGRSKWTVSIPPNHEFPLTPIQYADICAQNMEVAATVADLHSHVHREHFAHYDYYHVDQNFMDVAEAEAHGLLPGIKAKNNVLREKDGSLVGENKDGLIDSDICDKTLTFVLETSDAGLGKGLMMLWTAFGLAQKEGRHFFGIRQIHNILQATSDSQMQTPTTPRNAPMPASCSPSGSLGCDRNSHLGGSFNDYFEDAKKMEVYRQKPIFEMARLGYEALFHLSDDDNKYVDSRAGEFSAKSKLDPSNQQDGMVIGIHVRHGDRRPYEFQYKDSYIPLTVYSDKAHMLINEKFNHSLPNGEHDTLAKMASALVIASDDPDVYDSEEFKDVSRAQEQIRLASKNALDAAAPKPNTPGPRKFVDDTVGWEGGFYAGMFWSLGKPSGTPKTAVETPDTTLPPTTEALRLRELVGRAYLMDLAVLGKASDKIVCTVSATGCRLLAVMMGWEKAIDQGGFVNVDGNFNWRGVEW
ncbi:uncharacterized protein Bfra_000891 [Botrytis fragariae]|uniref:Uncharacterized protein n=1 Tax=Botrytis fragariae TaxID=1964551 RepID=A0A8H6B3J6_9HELO|nr:uncharacterized protein Bfra_000891 [Botrytis fragariae]KAF5878724.1 hypothetical protein Bfra_000891 [Botrytis fragariae]